MNCREKEKKLFSKPYLYSAGIIVEPHFVKLILPVDKNEYIHFIYYSKSTAETHLVSMSPFRAVFSS